MKHFFYAASAAALSMLATDTLAQDNPAPLKDIIIVTGHAVDTTTDIVVSPDHSPMEGPDIVQTLTRTPGMSRIANGALSGQVQYRGLFGERLNLRVDGQSFASGGPNLMDPVFHYAPTPLIAAVEVDRGISPVSAGPGLAGGADAVFKRTYFSDGTNMTPDHDLTIGGRSADSSYAIGGIAGASNETVRFNLLGAFEKGEDLDTPAGTITATQFERAVYGLSAGWTHGAHTLSFDARRQNTGPSGNPPFPMDIRYFDTDFAKAGYEGEFGALSLSAEASFTDVSHAMNNFDLRPMANPMRKRETYADATTRGFNIGAAFDIMGGRFEAGIDTVTSEHDVTITNPDNAGFFLNSLPNIEMIRTGLFGQWTGEMGPLGAELGLRVDSYDAEAGTASTGSAVPMGPTMLAMAFNGTDRSWDDTTFDAAARLWTTGSGDITWRATLARKTHTPNYVQLFSWLPTGASGGLADGNIYVGDQSLKSETALILEGGFDYVTERAYLRPTVFVRQIDNYIQGVPFDSTVGVIDTPQEMVANMNGDSTPLRFANVDARLTGFDIDGGYDFDGPLRADFVATYVRGERRDIDDNLYRITPPRLTASLSYEGDMWRVTGEAVAVAEQSNISMTNSEAPSDGYATLNLYGDWEVRQGMMISAGVENLLDESYRDHLSGYNRVMVGDIATGVRLPGAGRGVFVRLHMTEF